MCEILIEIFEGLALGGYNNEAKNKKTKNTFHIV